MGIFKRQKREETKKRNEMEDNVEYFRGLVGKLGRIFGMAIVPFMAKYGLEIEIQVLQDRESKKALEELKELAKQIIDPNYITATPESGTPQGEEISLKSSKDIVSIPEGHKI